MEKRGLLYDPRFFICRDCQKENFYNKKITYFMYCVIEFFFDF